MPTIIRNGKELEIENYFEQFQNVFFEFLRNEEQSRDLQKAVEWLKETKYQNTKILLVGNGGSSAVAEHMAIDFTKNAGLKALAVSGSPMLTTFSNDYGYEKVFQKAIEAFGEENDVLIAISSSGASPNILNACRAAREKKMKIITLSGFNANNPLRLQGGINFWINSKAFGYVELIHNLILHYINDTIIGSVEYLIR